MGVVSGGACAERRMCRHLVAPSFENQFFSGSCAFWTLSGTLSVSYFAFMSTSMST